MNGALEEVGHERVEPVTLHDNHFVNLCFEGFGLAQLIKSDWMCSSISAREYF